VDVRVNQQIIGAGIDSLNMGEIPLMEVLVLQLKAWADKTSAGSGTLLSATFPIRTALFPPLK
jgi:hypothetical protein